MKKLRQSEIWALLSLAACAFGAMGTQCAGVEGTPVGSGQCEPGSAQIAVWDGFLQNICGCGGTDGQIFTPPAPLTCTLPLGATVFIHYDGPILAHQIVPVGTPAMPASSVYDPTTNGIILDFAFKPDAAGTYEFRDSYQADFTGSFVVTP